VVPSENHTRLDYVPLRCLLVTSGASSGVIPSHNISAVSLLGMSDIQPPIKQRIYEILESSNPDDLLSQLDDWGVTLLIIFDISTFILETSKSFKFNIFLIDSEVVVVICFTILYVLQLWSCTTDVRYNHPLWGRVRYALTPLALIDLLAILPFYLLIIFPHVRLVEATDLLRLLRLLKLIRYSEALRTILRVILAKADELIMTFVAVFILLIFASSVMFFAEREAQPEVFPSIPAAMWWGVVTLTTVGYGDVYPVTTIGKLFGAALAFIGIGLFALPAGIIASGFSAEVQRRKELDSNKPPETASTTCLTSQQWTPEQKQLIGEHVEQRAELMVLCIETAKRKFGDRFEDEAIVRDLATSLYLEAVRKFNL
jgi:voltage-gated potassium channel